MRRTVCASTPSSFASERMLFPCPSTRSIVKGCRYSGSAAGNQSVHVPHRALLGEIEITAVLLRAGAVDQ